MSIIPCRVEEPRQIQQPTTIYHNLPMISACLALKTHQHLWAVTVNFYSSKLFFLPLRDRKLQVDLRIPHLPSLEFVPIHSSLNGSSAPRAKRTLPQGGGCCLNGLVCGEEDMGYSNGQEHTVTTSTLFWLCWKSVTSASHIMRWSVLTVGIEKCVRPISI